MRRRRKHHHGYPLPDGSLEPDLQLYLLARVREWYALHGNGDLAELERRTAAALAEDCGKATPESPFPPIQLETVWM